MNQKGRNAMRTVKVHKDELLKILVENKKTHIKDFNEAVKDYKKAVVNIVKDNLVLAKTGDFDQIGKIKNLPNKPVSYEDNYSRAIRMLELSVEDTIELEDDVFNQLVLDEWVWKHNFTVSNALYKTFVG